MPLILNYILESDKDRFIYETYSKLLDVYNKSTNQILSFEFNEGYVIVDKRPNADLLNLFYHFGFHTIDMIANEKDEAILSSYILGMLKSRCAEIKYFSKNDSQDRRTYVITLYSLLSNFNFSFLSKHFSIIDANQKLEVLKNEFELQYKCWL